MSNDNSSQPVSVLIIENDDFLREVIIDLLGFSDLSCLDTPSGLEGVRLFQQYQDNIDLVILDMGLPDKNGDKVVQELHDICPDIEIVIISGRPKEILDQLFQTCVHVSVVQKPFEAFWFSDMVNELIGHQSQAKSKNV